MSSRSIRRLIVWVVSMGLGLVMAWVIITFIFPIIKPEATGITIGKYGRIYFLTTAVPLGFVVLIWLDYFLDTQILVD